MKIKESIKYGPIENRRDDFPLIYITREARFLWSVSQRESNVPNTMGAEKSARLIFVPTRNIAYKIANRWTRSYR